VNAAFTICSLNYLPQALTLADSARRHAPDWKFFVGLVDVLTPESETEFPDWVTVVEVGSIGLSDLEHMASNYNIVELCTAVKPSFFRTIFKNYPAVDQVHYLDPDTCLFSDPAPITAALAEASILLTPHHYTPIPLDGAFPAENLALNHGIYNLGYLGLRRGLVADRLLDWWEERMRDHCRIDLKYGWFVDQLFFNYVPIYFDEVCILRHPGVNAAYWNFHERYILENLEIAHSGNIWPLILYHFSGFSPLIKDKPTRADVRLDWASNPGLKSLLSAYADELTHRGYERARSIPSEYLKLYQKHRAQEEKRNRSLKQRLARRMRALVY
jgi:hypothetical protein